MNCAFGCYSVRQESAGSLAAMGWIVGVEDTALGIVGFRSQRTIGASNTLPVDFAIAGIEVMVRMDVL
jgi:hypothetical protein